MRIALVVHHFPPQHFGGVGTYTQNLAGLLASKGHEVTVITGDYGIGGPEKKPPYKVIRLKTANVPPRALWFQLKHRKRILELAKGMDIVNIQSPSFVFHNKLRNAVVTFHTSQKQQLRQFLKVPLKYWTLKEICYSLLEFPLYNMLIRKDARADNKISVGSSLAECLKKDYGASNLEIIQTGIAQKKIGLSMLLRRVLPKKRKTRVFFAGRLYYSKGVTLFLDAMRILEQQGYELESEVYGDGPLRKRVLASKARFHGFVEHEQLLKAIQCADICVIPSMYEAFSMLFMEIMNLGKPLIALDKDFSKEMVRHGYDGLLVKPDAKSIARATAQVMSYPELRKRLGANARNTVRRKFSQEIMAERYIRYYEKIKK